jgi:hypothetical protein
VRRVLEESHWEGIRSKGVMVLGVTTTPVGVVGGQGDTGERGDMTGSHQHLRSYAARTLHRGVGYVSATLLHTRAVLSNEQETRAFLFYPVGVPESVCVPIVYVYVHAA